ARAVLDRLAAGPPVGTVAPGGPPADSPVRWLVDNGLLVALPAAAGGAETVELPREVGLLLRREAGPLGPIQPRPPVVETATVEPKAADSAGAGQAMEAVRWTEGLLEALGAEPAPVLRSGGLGVRDLRRLARTAGVAEPAAALLLEACVAAGLLGEAEQPGAAGRAGETRFLPSVAYEGWRALPIAERWYRLARGWLVMTRQPGLVGQRDDRDRPISALAPESERAGAPAARRGALGVLAELPPGAAPAVAEVLRLLAWRAPRRARGRETMHREALEEAQHLGLTGLGSLTGFGRLLLAEGLPEGGEANAAEDDPLGLRPDADGQPGPSAAMRALDALLPAPVDHLLVQADLTVVVPGPPEPALADELELIAEPESSGGASVYRVTADSVRRALDAGYLAGDLHTLFARRSRTPVPQALTYLIDDVARRHGGLRAGPAGAYLRSDDEPALTQVLADKRLSGLNLRRLAPTVLVTPLTAGRLLTALREAGYAPVAEDATGAAVLTRPRTRRAPGRGAPPGRPVDPLAVPRLTAPRVLGIVEQIRRGDAAARAARRAPVTVRAANGAAVPGPTPVQAHAQALAVLQQAVRDKALVWVGYVDAHGNTASRLVRPVSISAGYLRAEDERTEMLHTFALHRITAAVLDE
ncbi:helicase-associated domain-containing protein, partial [Rhizomonospora bruguierae]|uniref:helicase-associated domain-containing protein n=1 Tax=Rhizomonospora bruguierae TaxID=1581705 RepID=UPI001BCFEB58